MASQGQRTCAWSISREAEPDFGARHYGAPGNTGENCQDAVVDIYGVLSIITSDLHQSSGSNMVGMHRNGSWGPQGVHCVSPKATSAGHQLCPDNISYGL